MMYELGNWMAAVVFPTPAGPNMNSLSRFVTAAGFLARSADIGQLLTVPVVEFDWRRAPPAEGVDAALVQCLLGIRSIPRATTEVTVKIPNFTRGKRTGF